MKAHVSRTLRSVQRSILAGIITIGPLFVTYLIFSFLLNQLAQAGLPAVRLLTPLLPEAWFRYTWIQPVMAILLTLIVLYVVGRVTSLVIGRQAFGLFESILERLPFVAKVYTSVRQLLDTMMAKKDASQRVVLIDFPIRRPKEHWISDAHHDRRRERAAVGGGAGAERHQSHVGLSADSSHGPGDRDRPDHGTGDEHGDDRRRCGAGDDSVLKNAERRDPGSRSENPAIGFEVGPMQETLP